MENENNIELRTDEVQDILQKMPHWTVRWGTTVIVAAVLLLLLFAYLFRYPDLIRSEVVISASNPPAEIKARSTGKITNLFIADEELVQSGEAIAVIENAANYSDILKAKSYLKTLSVFLETYNLEEYRSVPSGLNLGTAQNSFADFHKLMNDYHQFLKQHFYAERIRALDGQIEMKALLLDRLEVQTKLETEQYQLATKSYQRDSALRVQSIISQEDFETSRSAWLNAGLSLEAIKKEEVSTRSDVYELQQQKASMQLDYDNEMKAYQTNLVKAYNLAVSEIENWMLQFVLISPIDGKASFNKVWAVNQNVSEGETVVTVVPETPTQIVGKAYVSVRGAGKVKQDQRVNIKLSNYPYMEYGMLIGKVKRIAPVPVNNFYAIEIELPDQLTTNYGRDLDMQQELWGNCEIITEDLRLIQRVVYPIKAVIERNKR